MTIPTIIDLTGDEPRGAAVVKKAATKKRKLAIKDKPHALLWVPHNGPKSNTWSSLKVIGVYRSKEKAMAERERVMSRYDQCGHGDILVGGTWHDEIDLIVKPADCFLDG